MIINSAYSLTTPMQHNPSPDDSRWATIWKLSVPERERMFVRLVRHGRLLTNPQRSFFKSTLSVVPGGIEDLDHVFRSCPKVLAVWSLLPNPPHFSNLQETSFMVWLESNLRSNLSMGDLGIWKDYFVVSIWWICRWRNEGLFFNKLPNPLG